MPEKKINYKNLDKVHAKLLLNMDASKSKVASWLGNQNYDDIMKLDKSDTLIESVKPGSGLGHKSKPESSIDSKAGADRALASLERQIKKRRVQGSTEPKPKPEQEEEEEPIAKESKSSVSKKAKASTFLDNYKKQKKKK